MEATTKKTQGQSAKLKQKPKKHKDSQQNVSKNQKRHCTTKKNQRKPKHTQQNHQKTLAKTKKNKKNKIFRPNGGEGWVPLGLICFLFFFGFLVF